MNNLFDKRNNCLSSFNLTLKALESNLFFYSINDNNVHIIE